MEVSARCFAMALPTCALQSPYLCPLPRSLHCARYFHDAWNVFDFLVIVASFLPFGSNQIAILRLMRLLRLLKLVCLGITAASTHSFAATLTYTLNRDSPPLQVRALPKLRILVIGLLKSFQSIGYVMLMVFMLFYLWAVIGVMNAAVLFCVQELLNPN